MSVKGKKRMEGARVSIQQWRNDSLHTRGITGVVGIGIAPLELVTCSHVFSPQLPLNQTCKPSHPIRLKVVRGNQEYIATIWCLCTKTIKLKKREVEQRVEGLSIWAG